METPQVRIISKPMPLLSEKDVVRFLSFIDKDQPSGCWEWKSFKNAKGYGRFKIARAGQQRSCVAHRVSFALFKTIPDPTLTIDHLCRNRGCVNPDHLEEVSFRVNLYRGESNQAVNARKTTCINGHEFTPENTYINPNKPRRNRSCRTCGKLYRAVYYGRKTG